MPCHLFGCGRVLNREASVLDDHKNMLKGTISFLIPDLYLDVLIICFKVNVFICHVYHCVLCRFLSMTLC